MRSVGILGVGAHLPPTVRSNDWWPTHVVDGWRERWRRTLERRASEEPGGEMPFAATEGVARVGAAIAAVMDDPFQGAVERRVAPDSMPASEMEVLAAKEALDNAGVAPSEIDLLLSYSIVPDYLTTPNACRLHERLGLPERCFATAVEGACNSFQLQLMLAEQMLRTGQARRALLVQSNQLRRLIPADEPYSAWFGDGATAVVLGEVSADRGILGRSHRTDGSVFTATVSDVPGKRWYEHGAISWHPMDRAASRKMLLTVADLGKQVVHEALEQAALTPVDVGFYASHQATKWFRALTQDYLGLTNARAVDTFPWAGSLSACNIPLGLACGVKEGLLRDGDVVAMYSGGSGQTWSGTVLRWGR